MEKISQKKGFLIFVKLLITAGLIYWFYVYADRESIKRSLFLIEPMQLLVAASLHIGVFLLGATRWWLLLRQAGVTITFQKILPSYYLGLFFNNLLPTSMGGDVVRIVHLKFRGLSTRALISSVMIDRFIGLSAVVVVGTVSIMLSPDIRLRESSKVLLLALVTLGFLFLWFMLTPGFISLINRLAHRYRQSRIRKALLDVIALCYSLKATKRIVLTTFTITLIMQSLVIMIYYYLGSSIHIELLLVTYFAIIPIVFLATSIPISMGGLGVREGALVGLLVSANIDIQHAIALSLLYLIVLWLSSLPGAAVLLFRAKK